MNNSQAHGTAIPKSEILPPLARPRIITLAVLALCIFASVSRAGDEAPQARAYFDFLHADIAKIQADLPQISAAAAAAAKPIAGGRSLAVLGGEGLAAELHGRAGGFMGIMDGAKLGDPLLIALGVAKAGQRDTKAMLQTQIDDARKYKDAGSVVVAIASLAQLRKADMLDKATAACTFLIDNHAPAQDGLFIDNNDRPYAPTFTVANAIVAWTFEAELFAALTRLDKTPVMYQSFMVKGGRERAAKYKGRRFHDDMKVPPQPAGGLGNAYLTGLDALLTDIGTASWKALVAAEEKATDTLITGGHVYIFAAGHYPPYHAGGKLLADPGIFAPLNAGKKIIAQPGLGDYVIALGYSWPPGDEYWDDPKDLIRAGDRGVAWVITGYDTKPVDLKPRDVLIDQQWPEGDALVKVPGYDIRLFPPSAITTEAIEWAIEAQVVHDVREQFSKMKHPPAPGAQ